MSRWVAAHSGVMFFLAARRSCIIRAAPISTVVVAPATADSKYPTPTGRLQSKNRKWTAMELVFCATKISRMIRITRPTTSAHHAAASRVKDERVARVLATPPDPDGDSVFMLVTSP